LPPQHIERTDYIGEIPSKHERSEVSGHGQSGVQSSNLSQSTATTRPASSAQSGVHQSSVSSNAKVDQSSPNVVTATGTHPSVGADLDKSVETKHRTHHVEKKTEIRG